MSARSHACTIEVALLWPVKTSGSGCAGIVVALPGEGDVGLGFMRGSGLNFT